MSLALVRDCIKGWRDRGEKLENKDVEMMQIADDVCRDGISFRFNYEAAQEHVEFAHELANQDQFRMPFARCCYEFPAVSNCGIHKFAVAILIQEYFGEFTGILGTCFTTHRDYVDLWGCFVVHYTRLINSEAHAMRTTLPSGFPKERIDAGHNNISYLLARAIGYTVSLMSSGVEQRIEPAPERLNRKRARHGKPPIGEIRQVFLKPGAAYAKTHSGGTHASPVMHWRRGHFRTLQHARFYGKRTIAVAPALIGASEAAREQLKARTYLVDGKNEQS